MATLFRMPSTVPSAPEWLESERAARLYRSISAECAGNIPDSWAGCVGVCAQIAAHLVDLRDSMTAEEAIQNKHDIEEWFMDFKLSPEAIARLWAEINQV
jgi:hypothetical protein